MDFRQRGVFVLLQTGCFGLGIVMRKVMIELLQQVHSHHQISSDSQLK